MIRIVCGSIPRAGVGYCRAEADISGVRASVTIYSSEPNRRKYRIRTGQATRDQLLSCPAGSHLLNLLSTVHYQAMSTIALGAVDDNSCAMHPQVEALYYQINSVQLTALTV